MGLSIGWELQLPDSYSRAQVKGRMSAWRAAIQEEFPWVETAPLPLLTSPGFFRANYRREDLSDADSDRLYLAIHTQETFWYTLDGWRRPTPKRAFGESSSKVGYGRSVDARWATGFTTLLPEDGTESPLFAIGEMPRTVTITVENPFTRDRNYRFPFRPGESKWRGKGWAKTTYAALPEAGGIPNFLSAHLAIIRMLDIAAELGFAVHVEDEGDYWVHRDVDRLVAEQAADFENLAAFAGAFADAASAASESVDAPILSHPLFERLEQAGMGKAPPELRERIKALVEATKKARQNPPTTQGRGWRGTGGYLSSPSTERPWWQWTGNPVELLHAQQHTLRVPHETLSQYPPPESLEYNRLLDAIRSLPPAARRWAVVYAAQDALPVWEQWAYGPEGVPEPQAAAVGTLIKATRAYLDGEATKEETTEAFLEAVEARDSAYRFSSVDATNAFTAAVAATEAHLFATGSGLDFRKAVEALQPAIEAATFTADESGHAISSHWLTQWWVRTLARLAVSTPERMPAPRSEGQNFRGGTNV